MEEDSDSDDDL